MLSARIIPTMLIRGNQLVKGKQFDSWRSIGHAVQAAQIHAARGVDELCILDIGATPGGTGPNFDRVRELSQWCFTPLTVGGGVRSIEDISQLLCNGADKVCIGTMAHDHEFLVQSACRFGSQAIMVAIDYKTIEYDGQEIPCVMSQCGTYANGLGYDDCCYPMNPVAWAKKAEELGAGEILLTCIDREGMMDGYDLDMLKLVSGAVSIPVIAHGGCGTPHHALDAIGAGANAVGIGSMFAFTDETPRSVAEYLDREGVEVRLPP